VRLRDEGGRVLRVAHRGVWTEAPQNSLEALEAALGAGFDLVEVDVHVRDETLVLAHSLRRAGPGAPELDEALALFAERAAPSAGIQLDMKPRAATRRLVEAVRRHELVERTLVSSTSPAALRHVRVLEPALATGFGYPHDRTSAAQRGLLPGPVVAAALRAFRLALPRRIEGMLARSVADAAMLHHLVVTQEVVRRAHARGAAVFAWTVNDPAALARVVGAGVDGVITDDPLLGA
jgi:glycerophosphoryl diester phosphodiesterase